MNKKEFLNDLKKRLAVLDEQELKDIINEYDGIITEKVKDGKSEIEAVQEFGSIEELSAEILKAYKINPKYSSTGKDKAKAAVNSFEEWVKYLASQMSGWIKGAGEEIGKTGRTLNLELVLEIIIKIAILLVILAVLRVPFYIIEGLGGGFFRLSFAPTGWIFTIIWRVLFGILYLVAVIFIFWAMFREYFKEIEIEETKSTAETKKTDTKKVEPKTEVKKATKEVEQEVNYSGGVLLTIVRIFIVISFLLPLWLALAGLGVALLFSIYYVIIGINILGLIIVLVGSIIFISGISDLIYKLAFKIKQVNIFCIIPFIVSIVFLTIGGLIFAHNIMGFEFINARPSNVEYNQVDERFNISNNKHVFLKYFSNTRMEIDNNLPNDEVIITIFYITSLYEPGDIELTEEFNSYIFTYYGGQYRSGFHLRNLYNQFIENLKENKIYNYNELRNPNIVITGNEFTITTIKGE